MRSCIALSMMLLMWSCYPGTSCENHNVDELYSFLIGGLCILAGYQFYRGVNETREEFESKYGKVWNTEELKKDFRVKAQAPFVLVDRKRDNVQGTLMFNHEPRFYFHLK